MANLMKLVGHSPAALAGYPGLNGALRAARFDETATVEIVATVALNLLTNGVNNVAQTEIDCPKVLTKLSA